MSNGGLIVTAPGVPEGPKITTPTPVPNAPSSIVANTGSGTGTTTPNTGTGINSGQTFLGAALPGTGSNDFTTLTFIAQQLISQMSTATLVKIVDVYPASGSGNLLPGMIAPAGRVDVLPLVNMWDGSGNSYSHTTVYGLLYFRASCGPNAIIIDPEPGDMGLAVFADRDISLVKNTGAQANPGSRRRFDLPDGVYFGGLLAGTPTQYISFTKDSSGNRGVSFKDANNNTITTDHTGVQIEDFNHNSIVTTSSGITQTDTNSNVILTNPSGVSISTTGGSMQFDTSGNLHVTGKIYWNTATNATEVSTHIHSGVQAGGGDSGPPVPGS